MVESFGLVQEMATELWVTEVVPNPVGWIGAGIWLVVTEIEADGLAPPALVALMYSI